MKPIKQALLATTAIISLLSNLPVTCHAAQNAINVTGDITLKKDANGANTGIHFSDTSYQGSASPWSFKLPTSDIYFNPNGGGNVGIGNAAPTATLDVTGTVKAVSFTGDGTSLTGVAAHNHDNAYWKTTGNAGTVETSNFIGTTDNVPVEIRSNNITVMRLNSVNFTVTGADIPVSDVPNIIGGFGGNTVSSGVYGATISGGGGYQFDTLMSGSILRSSMPNAVSGNYGTVSGGYYNTAGPGINAFIGGGYANHAIGSQSTISGGVGNFAMATDSTVGGGSSNLANGPQSTVSGGTFNAATGTQSTVSGGVYNRAGGDYSWAGGSGAVVRNANTVNATTGVGNNTTGDQGTFVWADSTSNQFTPFTSTGMNQFLIKASGGVGINTNSPKAGTALDVNGNTNISGTITTTGLTANMIGSTAITGTSDVSVGVKGVSSSNTGMWAIGGGIGVDASSTNNGVGVKGATGNNIAVYGINTSTDLPAVEGWNQGNGDILRAWSGASGSQTLKFRVFGNGNANFAGVVTASNISAPSDIRLKTNIQPLENTLEKVSRLRGVSYEMKADESKERKIGVIAQELEQEYPEIVFIDNNGMKSVAYANLTPILIEAVKALKVENDSLKADNVTMKADLSEIKRVLSNIKQ